MCLTYILSIPTILKQCIVLFDSISSRFYGKITYSETQWHAIVHRRNGGGVYGGSGKSVVVALRVPHTLAVIKMYGG